MIRRPMLAAVPVLACALALAACGDDNAGKAKGRAAASQVLEGSVSDAMLPLDELQSQSPLAPPEPEKAPTSALSREIAGAASAALGDDEKHVEAGEGGVAAASSAPAAAKPAASKPAAPAASKSADPIGAAVENSRN